MFRECIRLASQWKRMHDAGKSGVAATSLIDEAVLRERLTFAFGSIGEIANSAEIHEKSECEVLEIQFLSGY